MTRERRWRLGVLGVVAALMLAALAAPRSVAGVYLLPFVAFFVLIIPAHELGHALAGALVGHRIVLIKLGVGTQLFSFKVWGVTVEINALPLGGATLGYPARGRTGLRTRHWIFAAGGLLANLGLYLVLRRVFGADLDDGEHHPFLAMATSVNWTVMLLNAIPFRMAEGAMSDGYQLLTIPSWPPERVDRMNILAEGRLITEIAERGDLADAQARAESLRRRHPRHASATLVLGQILHRARRHEEAREIWREGLAQTTEPDLVALLKNAIAWIDALLGRGDDLAEADRLSAEAAVALPDSPSIWGTRGSVLVRLGRGAEALPLLERGVAQKMTMADQAYTKAFLAGALTLCGRHVEAQRAFESARGLDPTCELLPWIESTLGLEPAVPVTQGTGSAPDADVAATTRAAAGAALLTAWRRDARIAAFAAMVVLPERLGMPVLYGFILAGFVSIMPDAQGVLAFGLACAWAAVIQASGQIQFGRYEHAPTGAAFVGLAFAVLFLWLFRRARRGGPAAPTRGPVVLGLLLGVPVAMSTLMIALDVFRHTGALGLQETFEGLAEEGMGLMALGGLWAASRRPWLRAASALPLGLALFASVGASEWHFARYAARDAAPNGAPITWSEPRPATLLRERTFAALGSRPVISPSGKTFAVFQDGKGWEHPSTIHVGDFGARLVDVEALAAVFVDDEEMLVLRRTPSFGPLELAAVRPFAGSEPVWTKKVPRLAPDAATLVLEPATGSVFVQGHDLEDRRAVVLRTTPSREASFTVVAAWDDEVPQDVYDQPIASTVGSNGAGALVVRRADASEEPPRPASRRTPSAVTGALWLVGSGRNALLSSSLTDLSCASVPGGSVLWCLPRGTLMRTPLLRIDTLNGVVERVPERIPFGNDLAMVDASHVALLNYAELRVIDVVARRGERLVLPGSRDPWHESLLEGALAVFHRDGDKGAATIKVYAPPEGPKAP